MFQEAKQEWCTRWKEVAMFVRSQKQESKSGKSAMTTYWRVQMQRFDKNKDFVNFETIVTLAGGDTS